MNNNCANHAIIKGYRKECDDILRGMGQRFAMRKGEQLRSNDLYYLIDGVCALCLEGETGRDLALIYFRPGRLMNFLPSISKFYPLHNFPGSFPLFSSAFFVKAISDSQLFRIDKDLFLAKYFQSLPLQTLITQALVENCYDLFSHIFNSLEKPAWQRVAMQIYENMSDNPPGKLLRKITYAEIATRLSIHPVTVAKIFRALQAEGIIKREHSQITVLNATALLQIAQGKSQLYYKSRKYPKNDWDACD